MRSIFAASWQAALAALLLVGLVGAWSRGTGVAADAPDPLAAGFQAVKPILASRCLDCHSGDTAEGEVDLAALDDAAAYRAHPKIARRVEEMVASGQMPPPDSDQPTDEERRVVGDWLRSLLAAEARAHAGDPGRVVLRRLNNAEYTHTIRDLTGVASLDPVKEFPADGGAGEGFTNTGQSLVMSPSLAAKYLDAAKGIAAHAVLVPDGLRFSAGDSSREWAEEAVGRIQRFYARFTQPIDPAAAAAQTTVKQGVKLDVGQQGFLPVGKYLAATVAERDRLTQGGDAVATVAGERGLSPKYLATLWQALTAAPAGGPSPVLDALRSRWKTATPDDVAALSATILQWQEALWKFNHAGQIVRQFGGNGGPPSWMEAATPLVESRDLRVKLAVPKDKDAVVIRIAATDAGDGGKDDVVVLKSPRLVAAGRADVPLRNIRGYGAAIAAWQPRIATTAEPCLAAAAEMMMAPADAKVDDLITTLAAKHAVDPRLLRGWLSYLGVGAPPAKIEGLLAEEFPPFGGKDFISGWRHKPEGSLWVLANASGQEVQVPHTMRGHSIVVHPERGRRVVVAWRSPITGQVRIEGGVRQAHAVCSFGITWEAELRRGESRLSLARGESEGQGAARHPVGPFDSVMVREGDMISIAVAVGKWDNNQCDATAVDLAITALDKSADSKATWDLVRDCSIDILSSNPHPDSHGRPNVWHFGWEADVAGGRPVIAADLALGRWLLAAAAERAALARVVAEWLAKPPADPADPSAEAALARMLTAPSGPLLGRLLEDVVRTGEPIPGQSKSVSLGLDPAAFGRAPEGVASAGISPDDLCFRAPHAVTFEIPRALAEGCEFVAAVGLHPEVGGDASVQVEVVAEAQGDALAGLVASLPVVARKDSAAWRRFEAGYADVRELFPRAVCYGRIVPVDEVVTLNLYYREDDQLRRLLLDDAEAKELDRLWDELLFIAQEPLELQDAYEQIMGYASQDRPDLVQQWTPLKPAIVGRAEAFRSRMKEVQPRQVDAVVALAGRAFRRPLEPAEEARLRGVYDALRKKDLPHEEALRAVITNVLVSPDFLYKIEVAKPGTAAAPVSDYELATRLSYFVWSSMPDAELLAAAESGRLHDPVVLKGQVRRMLAAPASRRLAEEFGTQWLHVHGFSTLDEKNADLFPTFAGLRADMEEETVLFLDDFFRNDRSILSLIDADHTFLNERLAKHYGIEGVTGAHWRRVESMRKHGRGSILGLATTLSTQAGASRTSPILRGNWLYETILGEKLPKPPKDVPQLAETVPTGLSERQLISMHSENAACAKCHRRIDPFGFALEEYDAIGRLRTTDASGKPIDTKSVLPDGATLDGQETVRAYLLGQRRDQFVRVFCRKLLGYALGRGVQLSDEPLLDEMAARLAAADYKISVAIEAIVTSPQFLTIRGRDAADDAT